MFTIRPHLTRIIFCVLCLPRPVSPSVELIRDPLSTRRIWEAESYDKTIDRHQKSRRVMPENTQQSCAALRDIKGVDHFGFSLPGPLRAIVIGNNAIKLQNKLTKKIKKKRNVYFLTVETSYNLVLAITHSYPRGNVAACSPSWVRQEAK